MSVDDSDCPGGIRDGVFTPGDPLRQLLSLDVTIDGIAFSMADDVDFSYGDFPEVGFANGFIVRIDLLTDDAANPFLRLFLEDFETYVEFRDASGDLSGGRIVVPRAVPEPMLLVLLASGVCAVAMRRMAQRHNGLASHPAQANKRM